MNAILALVLRDLKVFLGNRRALLFSFLSPLVLGAFMGYFFTGGGETSSRIPVLLADEDQSPLSRKLGESLGKDKNLEIRPTDAAQARELVRKGKATAALVIPKGFGEAAPRTMFARGARPTVTLLSDPSHGTEAGLVRGLLAQHGMEAVSAEVFTGDQGLKMLEESAAQVDSAQGLDPGTRAHLKGLYQDLRGLNRAGALKESQGQGLSLPYDLKEEVITSRAGAKYNGYAHSFAGMGVQFILFMGIEAGVTLLVLRQSGLWRRLRAAPVGRHVFLAARILSASITALILILGIFLVARVAFGVRVQGSLPGFLLIAAAFSLFTGAFGLLIASLGRNPEATRGLSIMATLFLLMLGGAWVPSFIFPPWLQKATLAMPTRWAIDGLEAMTWRGLGLEAAWTPAGLLLGCALVMGLLAWARFPFQDA
jgi:ABC-2 type transport system permease protein